MQDFLKCDRCPSEVRDNPEVIKIMGVLEEISRNNRIACERILTIIRNLRNYARFEESNRRTVNIHEELDNSLMLVQHQLKGKVEVVKEYGNLPQIQCYPNQLNQVFINIFVNAAQAMPDRGTLTIHTSQVNESIKIAVRDTGMGIPAKNFEKIFEPGFTTKEPGVGTGLGLAISYKIIQDHHGKIDVESKEGKGTCFTITLPMS
jgi:two-component system NtrC family sensor kinase